jgi:hypothetical protein
LKKENGKEKAKSTVETEASLGNETKFSQANEEKFTCLYLVLVASHPSYSLLHITMLVLK